MSHLVNLKNKMAGTASESEDRQSDSANENSGTDTGKNQPNNQLTEIAWHTHEFKQHERGKNWFTILIIVTLIFFVGTILWKNYTFAIVILSASLCTYIYAKKEPRLIDFKINHRGIFIDDKPHLYGELRSFWIFYDPPRLKELVLVSKRKTQTAIRIPIDQENPTQLRNFLLKYLREEEQEESLMDVISDLLKF